MFNKITIIFVIYKSGDILLKNLKNLKNFKKIIIDNDFNSMLENDLKIIDHKINYIKLNSNIGMSKAANLAFDMVDTEFFLYLTPDTIIDEKNILNLLKIFDRYKNVGLVCPVHLDINKQYSGNYFAHPITRILKRSFNEKKIYKSLSKVLPSGDFSVNTVWGAPILLKTSLIKKIGFFDKNFFLFFEDVDLCDKIRNYGHEIIETPDSFCIHYKGSSSAKSLKYLYITISSYKFSELYYFSKHGYKYVLRIYFHSLDFFLRFILNVILLKKEKALSNLFRLFGILRYIFYKKK